MRNALCAIALTIAGSFAAATAAASTPLYEWTFDGATGVPAVTNGGGTLTVTNSANGHSNFNATGVSGAAGDQAYDGYNSALPNQYNTADPAGMSSTSAGNVASGLGTMTQFTLTLWIKPSAPFPMPNQNGSSINARLMMAGTSSTYDQGAGGFHMSLNSGDKLQRGVNGNNPVSASTLSSTLTTANGGNAYNDWVFIAFGYDGDASNNVFFDPVIQAATGGAVNNNSYVYVGGTTFTPVLYDSGATLAAGNTSPGPVTFSSSNGFVFLGNRSTLNRDFTGSIDDVRIYNSVLSTSDLNAVRLSVIPEPATAPHAGSDDDQRMCQPVWQKEEIDHRPKLFLAGRADRRSSPSGSLFLPLSPFSPPQPCR